MKVRVKRLINEDLTKIRVLAFLQNDIKCNRTYLGDLYKDEIIDDPSYDLKVLIDNLNKNSFPLLFPCIDKLINEPYVDKQKLYVNLSKFHFGKEVTDPKFHGCVSIVFDQAGSYHLDVNILDSWFFVAMHEFNHFASIRVDGAKIFTGFMKSKRSYSKGELYEEYISGRGLNEGMTDYITSKQVFEGKMCKAVGNTVISVGYPICYQYVKCLTKLIGEENMIKWYYSGESDALYKELGKYIDEEDINRFDYLMDCFSMIDSKEVISGKDYNNRYLNQLAFECSSILTKLSINKFGRDITGEDNIKYINRKGLPKQFVNKFKQLDVVFESINTKA